MKNIMMFSMGEEGVQPLLPLSKHGAPPHQNQFFFSSLACFTGYGESLSLASSDTTTLLSLSETPRPPVKISPSDTHRRSFFLC
ncbi:hypothetical protein P8452_60887 [Trifolium repens]|nr:hypothetical protein P8452_60887 [Trifolium repens]